jgi:hypothetical protein
VFKATLPDPFTGPMMSRGWGGLCALVCAWFALGCNKSEQDPIHGPGASGGSAGSNAVGQSASGGPGNLSGGGQGGSSAQPAQAGIEMRFAAPVESSSGLNRLLAFAGGGAVRPGLESLEYHIGSVQICETLEEQGSGFSNPGGCLQLYSGDPTTLSYGLQDDWSPLADQARASNDGFVDLLDPTSRATLGGTTLLQAEHVRSYNYGVITWSLPIKVKATLALGDGSFLYTHDGTTTFQTIGVDNYRDYFTAADTALDLPPAEKAVVILPNGGNWFKFQHPLDITQADIDEKRQWVLDLVFNPEGIVKGFAGGGSGGNLRERGEAGPSLRGINVPMLDLAPVPHRASEQVVRESYLAHLDLSGNSFDVRVELYSVEGDPNQSVYGVDVKTLVTPQSNQLPPEIAKISSLTSENDGGLAFRSYSGLPIVTGFHRVAEELGTTTARLVCATHQDRAGAEGGAAIVTDSCPSANLDVTFTLVGRRNLDGDIPLTLAVPDAGSPADAGAPDAAPDAGG